MDALLSPHFSLAEFTRSQTATRRRINNDPPPDAVANMRNLCAAILEPLRAVTGPLIISSGYRSPALNRAIGGASSSQHCLGLAADVVHATLPALDLCEIVRDLHLPYDQLIWEGSWMHVSRAAPGSEPRGQILVAHFTRSGVRYTPGLPE